MGKLGFNNRLFAFVVLALLWGVSYAQNGYRLVKVIKNYNQTETLNPCYNPVLIDSSAHGEVRLTKTGNGKYDLLFIPENNFTGTDTVIVEAKTLNDQSGKLVWYSFVFCYVNSYLESRQDFVSVYKNSGQTSIRPLDNDSTNLSGYNQIAITQVVNATHLESVSFNDSVVTIIPQQDFEGKASLVYRVCDILGQCETNQIYISVVDTTNLNLFDTLYISTSENTIVRVPLPFEGFDLTLNPKKGTVSMDGASFTYDPHKNVSGNDTFRLEYGQFSTLIYLKIYNLPPANSIINSDNFYTPVNEVIYFNVSENDVKPIVSKFPILHSVPNNFKGTLEKLDNKGNFKYTPQNNYSGVQTFTYKVCPQGICEYTTVNLLIGDYEPVTTHTYKFKTKRNTPLLLSYKVPVDAYDFSSSNSRVVFYPGWDTVNLNYNSGCTSTIIGYNSLIYTPLLNTIGTETFTIEYCISSTGRCETADIEVEVEYEAKNCSKQCAGDCVWPGDVDLNGQVDMQDLLHIGYEFGKEGTQRSHQGIQFRSYHADDWGEDIVGRSIDLKHADANGDGTVDQDDLLAVDNSYHSEHSLIPKEVFMKGDFPFEIVNLTPGADSGDLAMYEVRLGDGSYPVIDLAGYSYKLDYNTDVVNDSSLNVDFYHKSWFSFNSNTVNLFKKPWQGRLESGFARAGGKPASGSGGTEVIVFIVEDDLDPFRSDDEIVRVPFYFSDIRFINSKGETVQLEDYAYILEIDRRADKNKGLDSNKLIVYPNPSKGQVMIHLNGSNKMSSFRLLGLNGAELISNLSPDFKHEILDLSFLTDGMYILQVETDLGLITKKIVIQN